MQIDTTKTTSSSNSTTKMKNPVELPKLEELSPFLRRDISEAHKKLHGTCRMEEFHIEHGLYAVEKPKLSKSTVEAWRINDKWDNILSAVDAGMIRIKHVRWHKNLNLVPQAVLFLMENVLHKDPRLLKNDDLSRNKLGGLSDFVSKNNTSIYNIVSTIYPDIKCWEMNRVQNGYFDNREHRLEALSWLMEKTGLKIDMLKPSHFIKNHLSYLLQRYYGNSIQKMYIDYMGDDRFTLDWRRERMHRPVISETERANTHDGRIAAVHELTMRLGKTVLDLEPRDFNTDELRQIIYLKYYGSVTLAQIEQSGANIDTLDWHLIDKSFFEKKENRVAALVNLCETTGTRPYNLSHNTVDGSVVAVILDTYYNGDIDLLEADLALDASAILSLYENKYRRGVF